MLRYLSARDSLGIVEYGSDVKARLRRAFGTWQAWNFTIFGFVLILVL